MIDASPTAGAVRDAIWPGAAIVGDERRPCRVPAPLSSIARDGVTFLSRALSEESVAALSDRLAGVTLICNQEAMAVLGKMPDTTLIVVPNPRLAFMRAVARFFPPERPRGGIHPTALIDDSATIDPGASIGAFCVVGPGCTVDADTILHPHVTLIADVRIGCRVTIASGTVIGADGFGYERNERGELEKFPHIGGVVIADDVEIGSNTSIDRGTLDATRIGARARIDNQVHIAHNVVVGEDAAIIAQAMIGGGVRIGDRAWIAPSATIMNQVAIGADAVVGLGAVVVKSVAEGVTVMGSPAQPDAEFRRTRAVLKQLADNV